MKTNIFLLVFVGLSSIAFARQKDIPEERNQVPLKKVDKIMARANKILNLEQKRETLTNTYHLSMTRQTNESEIHSDAFLKAPSYITPCEMEVLAGETDDLEGDAIPPQAPYLSETELFHLVQVGPIIMGDSLWLGTRTPFIYRPPKTDPNRKSIRGSVSDFQDPGKYPQYRIMYNNVYSGYTEDGFMSDNVKGKSYNPPTLSDRYIVSARELKAINGENVLEVDFQSRYPNSYTEVVGTVGLDKKCCLLYFDGELLGQSVWIMKEGHRNAVRLKCHIHTDYTHSRGFTEIEKSVCTASYGDNVCHFLLVNLGDSIINIKH